VVHQRGVGHDREAGAGANGCAWESRLPGDRVGLPPGQPPPRPRGRRCRGDAGPGPRCRVAQGTRARVDAPLVSAAPRPIRRRTAASLSRPRRATPRAERRSGPARWIAYSQLAAAPGTEPMVPGGTRSDVGSRSADSATTEAPYPACQIWYGAGASRRQTGVRYGEAPEAQAAPSRAAAAAASRRAGSARGRNRRGVHTLVVSTWNRHQLLLHPPAARRHPHSLGSGQHGGAGGRVQEHELSPLPSVIASAAHRH